jgi:hypothetical protein
MALAIDRAANMPALDARGNHLATLSIERARMP